VVQQQQELRSVQQTTTDGAGSAGILFNPQTQTKVIYRVVYPSASQRSNGGVTAIFKVFNLQFLFCKILFSFQLFVMYLAFVIIST